MATKKKTKTRGDGTTEYQRAIKKLADVLGRWTKEDGRPLDDYLDQVATDLEALVSGGAR